MNIKLAVVPQNIRIKDEDSILNPPAPLFGRLTLDLCDGPLEERKYEHPGFLRTVFEFEDGGDEFKYSNEVPAYHLWVPCGSRVLGDIGSFEADCGVLEGVRDTDEVWYYIDPTGDRHEFLLKMMGLQLELAMQESSILVKCKYYDSSSCDIQTIFYEVNYEAFLLLPNHLLFLDAEGNVEDIYCDFGGDAVEVTRV